MKIEFARLDYCAWWQGLLLAPFLLWRVEGKEVSLAIKGGTSKDTYFPDALEREG